MFGDAFGGRVIRSRALCWMFVFCCVWACFFVQRAAAQTAGSDLRAASAIAFDAAGNLYIADPSRNQVFEATLGGTLVVVAGAGVQGYVGDGGPATAAALNQPQGLAFGADGTLYVADTANQRVRAVSPTGVITTVAGEGVAGSSGDGGQALAARLRDPTALAVDSQGGLLICDMGNHRLRRVSGGTIATVAGTGVQGFSGDGGPAALAELDAPAGVSAATDGRVFVSDRHQHRVRVIGTDGTIQTLAGTGSAGFGGDGELATKAQLSAPQGLAGMPDGTLLVADAGNQRVRQINSGGVISTVAGSGVEGISAEGAASEQAALRAPRSVAVSSFGLPVVADALSGAVRELAEGAMLYQPAAMDSGRRSTVKVQAAASQSYGAGTLTVTVAGQVDAPQGQVEVVDGGVPLVRGNVRGGQANVDLSGLGAGTHTLTVNYLGDGLNPAATLPGVAVEVDPLAVTATASSSSVAYGAPLPGLSGTLSGVLPVDVGQVSAVFGTSAGVTPPVGSYPFTVSLAGPKAANYTVSLSPASGGLQVIKAGSSALLGKVGTGFAGLPLNLSAAVAASTSGVPTGSVEFLDGNTVVATAALSGGVAGAVYSAPSAGTHVLAVEYLGDANFLSSVSGQAVASVSAMPDFVLANAGSQSASTSTGGTATYAIAVSALPGPFTGAVALSATGLPAGARVSFSPPEVVPGEGSATVTVTVQTASAVSQETRPFGGGSGMRMAGLFAVGFLAALGRKGRGKLRLPWLLSAVALLAGCGARTVGEGNAGVLAQTYTLTVAGTGTNLAGAAVTHTTALSLTVQN